MYPGQEKKSGEATFLYLTQACLQIFNFLFNGFYLGIGGIESLVQRVFVCCEIVLDGGVNTWF